MRSGLKWKLGLALPLGIVVLGGCALWKKDSEKGELKNLLKPPKPPEFIQQATTPRGLEYQRIQSFGIVNALSGTGGIEPAGEPRRAVLRDMQKHEVPNPNEFIDSRDTAVVLIETVLPPGARRNDPVDLIVRTPMRPDLTNERTTSIKGGWLMPARISYTQMMSDGTPRSSDTLVIGTGAVVVRSDFEAGADPTLQIEGRILGGGVIQKDRTLDLRIRTAYQHVLIAKEFEEIINRRFHIFDGLERRGIAKAREDDWISIDIPPRYQTNPHRLIAVVGALSTKKDVSGLQSRLDQLSKMLAEPTTSQDAALQLEGIGQEGVSTLLVGMQSNNPEIRFYSAEALSYLDQKDAINVLVELARSQPAFRYQSLLALSGMSQYPAVEGLQQLMHEASTETRTGAFDAIRRRADSNSVINGQRLSDGHSEVARIYELPSRGGPLVFVSLRRHPDIVQFGGRLSIELQDPIVAGNGLLVVPTGGGLKVSRIVTGKPDAVTMVPATVTGLCEGIARVGGGFGGMVECLRRVKDQNGMAAQLAIDVLPQPLREYQREETTSGSGWQEDLPPEPVDPPAAERERSAWYDPRSWFSTIALSPDDRVS